MAQKLARCLALGVAAFVGAPLLSTSSCASAEEADTVFSAPGDAGYDVKVDVIGKGGTGGAKDSGGGSGGTGGTATGGGGTGATSGSGGGTCNPQTCPTPAAPAVKCCVTQNGPCGVDYKQGAGCQVPSSGDI